MHGRLYLDRASTTACCWRSLKRFIHSPAKSKVGGSCFVQKYRLRMPGMEKNVSHRAFN